MKTETSRNHHEFSTQQTSEPLLRHFQAHKVIMAATRHSVSKEAPEINFLEDDTIED